MACSGCSQQKAGIVEAPVKGNEPVMGCQRTIWSYLKGRWIFRSNDCLPLSQCGANVSTPERTVLYSNYGCQIKPSYLPAPLVPQ